MSSMEAGRVISIGDRFGRLTVESGPYHSVRTKKKQIVHLCRCDCGEAREVIRGNLLKGQSNSCGCLNRDNVIRRNLSHGLSRTRLYGIWANIIARTENPNSGRFKDYGGRGIALCAEWRRDFRAFRDWATANGYDDRLTIERKDNDLGYCPGNCTWIPLAEQARNRRSVDLITAFGETKPRADWARDPRCAVTTIQLRRRIEQGIPPEDAITKPARSTSQVNRGPLTAFGETKTIREWSEDTRCMVTYANILYRLDHGYDHESAVASPPTRGLGTGKP